MYCKRKVTFLIHLDVMIPNPDRNVHHVAVLKKTVVTIFVHGEYWQSCRIKAVYRNKHVNARRES
jgi:hypothetical protein